MRKRTFLYTFEPYFQLCAYFGWIVITDRLETQTYYQTVHHLIKLDCEKFTISLLKHSFFRRFISEEIFFSYTTHFKAAEISFDTKSIVIELKTLALDNTLHCAYSSQNNSPWFLFDNESSEIEFITFNIW